MLAEELPLILPLPAKMLCPDNVWHLLTCMKDSVTLLQIRRSRRRLMSTVCGHLFCSECIIDIIRTHKKCPTCRKRLTQSQVHPVYL